MPRIKKTPMRPAGWALMRKILPMPTSSFIETKREVHTPVYPPPLKPITGSLRNIFRPPTIHAKLQEEASNEVYDEESVILLAQELKAKKGTGKIHVWKEDEPEKRILGKKKRCSNVMKRQLRYKPLPDSLFTLNATPLGKPNPSAYDSDSDLAPLIAQLEHMSVSSLYDDDDNTDPLVSENIPTMITIINKDGTFSQVPEMKTLVFTSVPDQDPSGSEEAAPDESTYPQYSAIITI